MTPVKTPEQAPETVRIFLETIKLDLEKHPNKVTDDLIRERLLALTKEDLEYLEKRIRANQIPEVLRRNEKARKAILRLTHERLTTLSTSVEKWYDPKTWGPETKEKAKNIAIVGGFVVAGGLLLRFLWRKASRGTEKVREKVGSAWSVVKWTVGLGIAVLLAYLGFKTWDEVKKMREAFAKLKQLKPGAPHIPEKAGPAAEKAKKAAEQLEEIAGQKLFESTLLMQYDVARKAGISGSPRTFANEAALILQNAQRDIEVKEGEKTVTRPVLMRDIATWAAKGEAGSREFLRTIKVIPEPPAADFSPKQVEGAKLVLGYLTKCKPLLEKAAQLQGKKFEDLSFREATNLLQQSGTVSGALGKRLVEAIGNVNVPSLVRGDFSGVARGLLEAGKDVIDRREAYGPRLAQVVFAELLDPQDRSFKTTEEYKVFEEECGRLLVFLLADNRQLNQFPAERLKDILAGETKLSERSKKILGRLIEKIRSEEFVKKIIAALSTASDGDAQKDKEVEKAVHAIVLTKQTIRLSDAFQLYYFSRTHELTKQGTLPLVFKSIALLSESENEAHQKLGTNRYVNLFKNIALKVGEAALKNMDLAQIQKSLQTALQTIPPEYRTEVENVYLYCCDVGKEKVKKEQTLWEQVLKAGGVSGAVALGAGQEAFERARDLYDAIRGNRYDEVGNELDRNGWVIIRDVGGWTLYNIKNGAKKPLDFMVEGCDRLFDYATGQESDSEQNLAVMYGEAGVAYLVGRATLKTILEGRLILPSRGTFVRIAGWLPHMVMDVITASTVLKDPKLLSAYLKNTSWYLPVYHIRLQNALKLLHPGCGPEDIKNAIKAWRDFDEMYKTMDLYSKRRGLLKAMFDTKHAEKVRIHKERLAQAIQNHLKTTKVAGDAPDWLSHVEKYSGVDKLGKFEDEMAEAMRCPSFAPPKQPKTPPTTPEIPKGEAAAKGVPEAPKARPWSEVVKGSSKAQEALEKAKVPLDPKLQKALNESPEFAKVLLKHLETADDPANFLRALNTAAGKVEDVSVLSKVMSSERGLARALKVVEGGGDLAGALSKTSRVLRLLRGAGRAAPVVLDSVAIFGTVVEMIETAQKIDAAERSGVRKEVIDLYKQEYAYHVAQLTTAGVGAGAGVCIIIGVGSAVAWPVALATIPVSAVIYGAYEGHKWKEAQERTAEDWAKENDLVSLFTDMRTYDFGERVGHAWDAGMFDWYEFFVMPLGTYRTVERTRRLISGEAWRDVQDLVKRVQQVDRKKVEALVAHTTTVTIPVKMEGEDGKPRDLTPDEVKAYQDALKRYVEAKVDFIWSQRKDAAHAIQAYGSVTELLEHAEAAGQLARERPQLEEERKKLQGQSDDPASRRRLKELNEILDAPDPAEAAKRYAKELERRQIDSLYAALVIQGVLSEGVLSKEKEEGKEKDRGPLGMIRNVFGFGRGQEKPAVQTRLEQAVFHHLLGRVQHAYVNFCVRCEEENVKNWWPDGDAPRYIRLYGMEKTRELLEKHSASIAQKVLAEATSPGEQGSADFQVALLEAERNVERLLADPKAMWDKMSSVERERMEYAFTGRDAVPEGEREKVKKGEELMRRINANEHGSYYTKQYGWVFNKYLYMTFNTQERKWVADLGGKDNLRDPASFTCDMWGGSKDYNRLLEDLASINRGESPSQ
jgi:hypothetical protein